MTDQPQNLRGLKAAVGGMGLLIVIGTAVVIGTIIHRLYARNAAPPPLAAPISAPAAPVEPPMEPVEPMAGAAAQLQPGEHIAGIAAAGAYVAVWVHGPQGDRLLLLDPARGALRVELNSAP